MSAVGTGGPAFPPYHHGESFPSGMSLRDWFAGQALAGILAGWPHDSRLSERMAAEIAYLAADEMLKQREGMT